jgi:hypothetical protein
MDLKLDLKTIFWIGGLLLIFVGALLLVGQVALARRYKGISNGLNLKTSMPGLTLIVLGIMLLLGFWPQ